MQDLRGVIHGRAYGLQRLLRQLGCSKHNGFYKQPKNPRPFSGRRHRPRPLGPGNPRDRVALCGGYGSASATAEGWSVGRQNPIADPKSFMGAGHRELSCYRSDGYHHDRTASRSPKKISDDQHSMQRLFETTTLYCRAAVARADGMATDD
jgi:hypothetical protein